MSIHSHADRVEAFRRLRENAEQADPDEVARELIALLRMRAHVHKRIRELTGESDSRTMLVGAHRLIDEFRARRQARKDSRNPAVSGWGKPTETRTQSWQSVWATASAGLPGLGRRL